MALFRYPGGKTKYTDFILPALFRRSGFTTYVEPFLGGGSVALAMAKRFPNVKLILNDLDCGIASFWDLVANAPDAEFDEIVRRILDARPTVALFAEIKDSSPTDRLARAFRTLFLNRTSWGGMGLRPLGGRFQTSKGKIDSRWSGAKLVQELYEARRLLRGRTTVLNADFATVVELASGPNAMLFLDPQYYEAGNQLYNFKWTDADHTRLREALEGKENWVMSYDDHPFIRSLYSTTAYLMAMKYSLGKKRKKLSELLLFPRLEFQSEINASISVRDTLRIWVKATGPGEMSPRVD